MSTERKWCPHHWLDERAPVFADRPCKALRSDGAGGWSLVSDEGETLQSVAHGDVVEWCYFEERGRFRVFKRYDGTYEMVGRPSGAVSHWWVPGDDRTIYGKLDELVTKCLQAGELATIEAFFWSAPIAFQVEIDGPGQACFEPVETDRRGGRRV